MTTEPLSDARLAKIRASYPFEADGRSWYEGDAVEAFSAVVDLMAEVDRLRAKPLLVVSVDAPLSEDDAARFRAQLEATVVEIRKGSVGDDRA